MTSLRSLLTAIALATLSLSDIPSINAATVSANPKQRYQLTLPKYTLDTAIATFGHELDIWKVSQLHDGLVQAEVYIRESTAAKLEALGHNDGQVSTPSDKASYHHHHHQGKRVDSLSSSKASNTKVVVQRNAVDTAKFLDERADTRAACSNATAGWLDELGSMDTKAKYVDSAFFDCWRQPDEVFTFLDTLVKQNPTLLTKIDQVTTTYENRTVPGYKISTGTTSTTPSRKSIYTQALIHAREWHAGSTCYYTIAAFVDGLRSGDATIQSVFDEYDWYFVPILNLDGHLYSWSDDRYWRKNRRQTLNKTTISDWGEKVEINGVDLNRNYGPKEFFNLAGDTEAMETYPGTGVLSEPETAGSWEFLKSLPNLRGAIDLHTFSGDVLRPFGNQPREAPAPYGEKLKAIGDNMRDAIMDKKYVSYKSRRASEMYLGYGVFMDAVFLELNNTPAFTIEMEGEDFVMPETIIRTGAAAVIQGLIQFAKDLNTYDSSPITTTPDTSKPADGSSAVNLHAPLSVATALTAMATAWAVIA